jgi:hypothetical protein
VDLYKAFVILQLQLQHVKYVRPDIMQTQMEYVSRAIPQVIVLRVLDLIEITALLAKLDSIKLIFHLTCVSLALIIV